MRCSLAVKGKAMAKKKKPDKLAQDAAAAKAANMSYGQWKAMQDQPVEIVERELPPGWMVCKQCGKPFKPTSKRKQLYCEAFCGKQAQRERERLKRLNK